MLTEPIGWTFPLTYMMGRMNIACFALLLLFQTNLNAVPASRNRITLTVPPPLAATNPPAPPPSKPTELERENLAIQRTLEVFTGCLVGVGTLQALIMWLQARSMNSTLREVHVQAGHMERQTGILERSVAAAQSSADSAQRSVEMAISAERAWVTTEANFIERLPDISNQGGPDKSRIIITLTNSGKSIAEILSMTVLAFFHTAQYPPSENPDYSVDRGKILDIEGETIRADSSRMVTCKIIDVELIEPNRRRDWHSGGINLYCYGKIEYRDNSGRSRLTQFGYRYRIRLTEGDDKPEAFYRVLGSKYNHTV
jgi:hypothetical protein